MAQLRQDLNRFTERDVAVLVVGPENAGQFAKYFAKHKLPFLGLPDPKHQVDHFVCCPEQHCHRQSSQYRPVFHNPA